MGRGRGGGGWSDDPDWVRPMPRGGGRPAPRRQPDFDDGWGRSAPRRRSAVHDPWGGPRFSLSGLPGGPMVFFGAAFLLIFAFLLGRCTAGGGGDDDSQAAATTVTTAASTTSTSILYRSHTVQENETLAQIASRFATTIEAITFVNNITDANHVFVGQVLKIPPEGFVLPTTTTPPTTAPKKKNN